VKNYIIPFKKNEVDLKISSPEQKLLSPYNSSLNLIDSTKFKVIVIETFCMEVIIQNKKSNYTYYTNTIF